MAKRRRNYSRDVEGFLPRLWRGCCRLLLWGWHHPQPVIALLIVVLVGWGMWTYVSQSEAFRIAHVTLPKSMDVDLPRDLEGKNIWQVDIESIASDLHDQRPWLDHVRVLRRLPDTLVIEPIPRVPVAILQMDDWFPVDAEGFILPSNDRDSWEGLPRLTGFKKAGVQLKAGTNSNSDRLKQAIRVLKTLQSSPILAGRRIEEVDIGNADMIRFMLNGEIEVRCGREVELDQHLERLRDVLRIVEERSISVRYIDVRFREPVVAPREA